MPSTDDIVPEFDVVPESLFVPDGKDVFIPTLASVGPWIPGVLHGGAVGALLAGLLEHPDQVMSRVLIEIRRPVPTKPLRINLGPVFGGRRVVTQSVVLSCDDRPIAYAHALRMRSLEIELPDEALRHEVVFDPADLPDLSTANQRAAEVIGRASFDSIAMATSLETRVSEGGLGARIWAALLLPVVPGRPASAVERVTAAADVAASGTHARLGFGTWSFVNADLVVSLGRPPVGDWIGLECDSLLGRTGTGQSIATIHDSSGPVGRVSQSVLIEALEPQGHV